MSTHEQSPIYLSLGPHDSIDDRILEGGRARFTALAEEQLQQTEGILLIGIEASYLPLAAATEIGELSKAGLSPGEALRRGMLQAYFGNNAPPLGSTEELEFLAEEVAAHADDFGTLEIAAELWTKYPGRVRVMYEGIPAEELAKRYTASGRRTAALDYEAAMQFAQNGQLDEAARRFDSSARDTAEFAEVRERLWAQRLGITMRDESISSAIVRLGSRHRPIELVLHNQGQVPIVEEDVDEQGDYYSLTPGDVLTEAYRSASLAPPTELEMYQAVVGELMFNTLAKVMQESEGYIDVNSVVESVNDAIQDGLSTMEQIRVLEAQIQQVVREGGNFIDALENL